MPAAFLSYAHVDDEHDRGSITEFRKALEGEVRAQTGRRDVRIFQDRDDIAWGQEWTERIDSSLDAVTFLVPVLTPSFLSSAQCRRELRRFLDRERRLGRRDLVLPVYWISAAALEDRARRVGDELAQQLAARQYTDWRQLRFKQLTDEGARRALAGLATHLRDALDPSDQSDRSAMAIRTHTIRVIHRAIKHVRTTRPDPIDLANILVDAVRDCGRLPERQARTLRWVCQSRLARPPASLRESAAESLNADPDIDPAYADTFHTTVTAVIETTTETAVSTKGDRPVMAALVDAIQEISARTRLATADGSEPALAALRQAVDAHLGILRAAAEQAERDVAQARQRAAAEAADRARSAAGAAAEKDIVPRASAARTGPNPQHPRADSTAARAAPIGRVRVRQMDRPPEDDEATTDPGTHVDAVEQPVAERPAPAAATTPPAYSPSASPQQARGESKASQVGRILPTLRDITIIALPILTILTIAITMSILFTDGIDDISGSPLVPIMLIIVLLTGAIEFVLISSRSAPPSNDVRVPPQQRKSRSRRPGRSSYDARDPQRNSRSRRG